ncbi:MULTISPECIES: ABC transporter permease [Microbacterium]|uniref:ABC transporter permease n=1 Tax=Microbacterium TaxID=33882 RepID=UPI0034407A7F
MTAVSSTALRARRARSARTLEAVQSYGVTGVLLLIAVVAALVFPSFGVPENLLSITTAACFVGLITIGQGFVLISGGIDLSVGSMVGLGSVLAALAAPHGPVAALLVPLSAGALVGLVNGLLIGKVRLAAFIVTLSSMLAVNGIAIVLAPSTILLDSTSAFARIGTGSFLGVNNLIWILVFAFAIAGIVLNRTPFGSRVFALGGNEDAARMMGINVGRVKISVYVISGALAGLAGALLAARLASGNATLGAGYELTSIASAVIGGILLTGGVGTMFGALCGVLLVGTIQNIINQIGTLNAHYQGLMTGLFLVVAVIIQGFLSNRRVQS